MVRVSTLPARVPVLYAFDDGGSQIDAQVGNGSKGVALVGTYAWAYQKKKGVSPALKRLVITDMLEYSGAPVDELISEDDLL